MPSAEPAGVRSPANEAIVLAMWADYERVYWVHRVEDGKVRWTASSPDVGHLLAAAGLPGRGVTSEAFIAMHGDKPRG